MTRNMEKLVEIKIAEFVKEFGLNENTKDEVIKRFGEVGLECLITNYKVQ